MNNKRYICDDPHIDIIIDIDTCNPEIMCVEELAKKLGHKIDHFHSDPLIHRYYSESGGRCGRELYIVNYYYNEAQEISTIYINRHLIDYDSLPKRYSFEVMSGPIIQAPLTSAEHRYLRNDEEMTGLTVTKMAKEIINNTHKEVINNMAKNGFTGTFKMEYFYDPLPQPKLVMTNSKNGKDYITVVWKDGSHTMVCRAGEDPYDFEKAIMFAVMKKMCGGNGCEMDRYLEKFRKCKVLCGAKDV